MGGVRVVRGVRGVHAVSGVGLVCHVRVMSQE